jgi:diguanylate cyclase (GGDEF)-like protein
LIVVAEASVTATASVGFGCHPGDAATPEDLLGYADRSMYRAKQAGRNTWRTG